MLIIHSLKRLALESCAFTLQRGEAIAVTGASGSGKSQLLRAIADLDPNEANMELDKVARQDLTPMQWRKRVMYVAAESGWWGDLVAEHFADTTAAKLRLAKLGLSEDALDWPVRRLSSGEKQRLSLIRALALNPDVLLLDEPTSALDQDTTQKVEDILLGFLKEGGSILIVTHKKEQVKLFGPGRLHVAAGRVQEVSS